MKIGSGNAFAGEYFERDERARQPVSCQPGFGRATDAQLSDEGVTARKLNSFVGGPAFTSDRLSRRFRNADGICIARVGRTDKAGFGFVDFLEQSAPALVLCCRGTGQSPRFPLQLSQPSGQPRRRRTQTIP